MVSKYLEQSIKLETLDNNIGFKSPIELEYYLLESVESEVEELAGKKVYGIEVVKKIDSIEVEGKYVKNFSCSRENTRKTLSKLATNTVTPIGLQFVLEDMIGV